MVKQIIPAEETKIVRNEGRLYYCTCLRVSNETSSSWSKLCLIHSLVTKNNGFFSIPSI